MLSVTLVKLLAYFFTAKITCNAELYLIVVWSRTPLYRGETNSITNYWQMTSISHFTIILYHVIVNEI